MKFHLLFAAFTLALFNASESVAAEPRPNILWITSEDHGPEMGCYGDKNARTPNIDALAAKGLRFKRAWSVAPVCAPARSAIISGMYNASTGGLHMRSMVALPPEIKLYPQLLREAGYYCTNNSKEDYNLRAPRDLWNESSGKAHWQKRPAGQPFFAVFNSVKSHESQIRTRPHQAIADPAKMRIPAYHPDTPEVREDWAQYYDKVSEADADAGRRLQEVEAAGLSEDTIVFYYGDHGSGMPRSKRWPGNSGLHVPLVVYFPEKWKHLAPREYSAGGLSERMVSFVDLAPTVLSIVGVQPPAWMQGHAFAGPHQTAPQPLLFGERGRMDERNDLMRSVTDGRYVYIRTYFPQVSHAQHLEYQFQTPTTRVWRALFDAGRTNEAQSAFWKAPRPPEELYDLENDRDEVRNLAAAPEHRATLERLRKAQREHLEAVRDVCFLPEIELHSRTVGSSPYELGHDREKYPLTRIVAAAELASSLDPAASPELARLLGDTDSAVRYWAVCGILMRGADAVAKHRELLRKELGDPAPAARIAAAEALGTYGGAEIRGEVLRVLGELMSPEKNGVLVAMAALTAIEALGEKAAPLHAQIRTLNTSGPVLDKRYSVYVPRLIRDITGDKNAASESAAPNQ